MLTPAKAKEILGVRQGRWVRHPGRFAVYFGDASRLLESKGWCQGAYARSRRGYALVTGKDKHAASFCPQGALERVTSEYKDYRVCKLLLAGALGVEPHEISMVNDRISPRIGLSMMQQALTVVTTVLEDLQ